MKAGEWLVEYSPSSTRTLRKLNVALSSQAVDHSIRISEQLGDRNTFLVRSDLSATLDEVKSALAGTAGVKFVEPNYAIYQAAITPNDTDFANQWALSQSADHDIDATEAWELSTGSSGVVIAVPDSGIDYNHVDLSMNAWKNYAEIAGNGIDDDANGYVDDVRGWDWVNNDNDPADDNGHGTIVAGEIGATGNNSTGVAGVAWQVKLMPLKFIASTGLGTSGGAISGMKYALAQKQKGINVRAINASWVNNSYSPIFHDTIVQLKNSDILFVAGAGNGGSDSVGDDNDALPTFPASYTEDNVIAVAATDVGDHLADFSNYGAMTVALAAPGVGIESTLPGNGYGWSTGTSDSAPFVSGTVALAAAAVPTATAAQIKSALISGVDRIASLQDKVLSGGRLNARKTLELLMPLASGDGLLANYYDNADFTGASVQRIDPNVSFDWMSTAPLTGISRDTYSVRWTGSFMPATSENYTIYVRADDGARLWINDQLVIDRWTDRPLPVGDINQDGIVNTGDFNILGANFGRVKATFAKGDINGDGAIDSLDLALMFANWGVSASPQENSVTMPVIAGTKYSVRLEYYQNLGRASARLSWSSPTVPKQIIPQNRLFSTTATASGILDDSDSLQP